MILRRVLVVAIFSSLVFVMGCGGSSSHTNTIVTTGSNVAQLTVNAGPANGYVNGAFTSVQVCTPGTSTCQTIDGILVDTGSEGLRVLSSAFTVSLTQQTGSDGNPIIECLPFLLTYAWGPVQTADITVASKTASAVPIQVIGGTSAQVPSGCSDFEGTPLQPVNTLEELGANGILGVGNFPQDCGQACAQTSGNPGLYYDCGTSCTVANESVAAQVQNPVSLFPTDNNGVIIELPSVSGAAATVTGSLVFGIGTETNNSLGSATIYTLNEDADITTQYNGQSYPESFLDSGSNGYYFLDSTVTGYPNCDKGFYCPTSTQNLSATNVGANGSSGTINFSVADANTLLNTGDAALGQLGGPNAGSFDWGLPFFYGRNVFTAIETKTTPGGTGPFWAY
jgi:hypothetical protein